MGSGKNYWVENELAKRGNVLLITSRKAIKDEIRYKENEFKSSSIIKSTFESQCVVMTHSKLAKMIRNSELPQNLISECGESYFDFIVIDEAHSVVCDSTFTDSAFHLWTFIQYAIKNTTVILMSATVSPMKFKLKNEKWKILDYSKECTNIKADKIKKNQKSNSILMV